MATPEPHVGVVDELGRRLAVDRREVAARRAGVQARKARRDVRVGLCWRQRLCDEVKKK